jgi:uncharacterized protein GlcG (DUF336 family)
MSVLTLATAQKIVTDALAHARAQKMNPLSIVVLDARGSLVAAATEDNNSLGRWQIAFGKANGSLFMGVGSKRLGTMAADRPAFVGALANIPSAGLIPVAGGVLIRDSATNAVLGCVGVSGDTSDNDEAAASTGIAAAGFKADGG